jgi:hypothetical protein
LAEEKGQGQEQGQQKEEGVVGVGDKKGKSVGLVGAEEGQGEKRSREEDDEEWDEEEEEQEEEKGDVYELGDEQKPQPQSKRRQEATDTNNAKKVN